ncbi:MAG TPA: tetratricopeptide repeat protein [Opitutaceae bacterium]|nr:tetratricopeptide repeat protein [Opitutaceae bacterium]
MNLNSIFSPLCFAARRGLKPLLVASLILGLSASAVVAQDNKDAPKKELSDKVSDALSGPIKTATEAKNLAEVLRLTDQLLATSAPNTYDRAVLIVTKAQTLIQMNKMGESIAPLEEALRLGDTYQFFDQTANLEMVLNLAQLYGQQAQETKKPDEQRKLYAKAYTYVRRWLDQSKTPNPDMEQFAASILLSQATLTDKVDLGLVKQAQAEVEKGMRMSVKPKEPFYVLLLATLQQQGDYKRSADVLEILVKMAPNNKSYWQTLVQTYLQLAQAEGESLDYNILAVIAQERAQQYGAMNTPKENYNLVAIYFNIHQYEKTIELLEAGLKNGSIPNEPANWNLLAISYQQLHQEAKAIQALTRATKIFPKQGSLDLQIGQLYYSLDKTADAFNYTKSALAKGVDKPGQYYVFLAYLGFELKKYEEALDAANQAIKFDPNSKDAHRLLDAIKDAIKERDAAKNQPA